MHRNLYICLALALLTVGVFLPVKNFEFVNYDDPDYVTANPIVQKGLTEKGVAWAFQNIHGEKTYWHPLTWITHEIDCQWFGLNPRGHHLDNVLFHTLNVLLLFWILARMTGAAWRSAIIAALFAIHPLQVDTVAWVTERKNLLSTFFMLLSLLAYVRYATGPTLGRYASVFLLFGMALMCKPAVVTFPCLLLLVDFWPLQRVKLPALFASKVGDTLEVIRSKYPSVPLRRAVLEKLPLLVLSFGSCVVTLLAHHGLGMLDASTQLPLWLRIENAVVSYARYIGKTFWPNDLAVLYPHPGHWPLWEIAASGILLLAITTLVLRRIKSQPYLFTGWFSFLGMLVPVIGIVQVGAQAMADRFIYVPVIGLFVMLVWTAAEFAKGAIARQRLAFIVAAITIVAAIGSTSVQLRFWKNSVALWEHTLRVTKNNYMAHHDLGVALRERDRLDEALLQFQAALSIKENPLSHFEASRVFELQQKTNSAIAELEASIRQAPRWPRAREQLALLLAQNGNADGALKHYAELLEAFPNRGDIHIRMALLLAANGHFSEAIQHYRDALHVNPNDLITLNNLAWLLCTNPDPLLRNGTEAAELATRACTLTSWQDPLFIATLAAAQAELGNYQQATGLATQARSIAMAAGQKDAAAQYENLRNVVAAGKPFRDERTK